MPSVAIQTAGSLESARPRYEVADIFREYGEQFRHSHSLPLSDLKVMHAIEVCRTAYLGGHLERCDHCGFERIAYNSCRNRHCPKCQALAKAEWLEKRKTELLPVEYFHNVFTIPHELNQVARCNKKVVFDLLFKTVAETLQEFAGDPKHGLSGKIGFTAILHTWDQKLLSHIHLHCVIPAGVLSSDGQRWIHSRKNFLFPVKALSRVFRGKFIDYLKKTFVKDNLIFAGQIAYLATEENFLQLINQLWKKDWVVYSKAPFNGPEKVFDYLGRYTHRVAIANHRIAKVEDGLVTFRYRDHADGDKCKHMTIDAQEFIHRFLLHVLPDSFMRIRHYGFLANRCKSKNLARCRELLGLRFELPEVPEETLQEKMLRLTGVDVTECPRCKQGRMRRVMELPILLACVSRSPPIMPYAGGSGDLMSTTKFNIHLLFMPTPFRRATVPVYICCPTCYKESYTERLFGIQLNDNNSLLRLLLLKVITQTIRRPITRMVGPYYNPHRKAGLILLRRPAAPRSGFVHRV